MATLTVLYGPPASGKSTYAAASGIMVVAVDSYMTMRERASGTVAPATWTYAKHVATQSLLNGESVVWDYFSTYSQTRDDLRMMASDAGAQVKLVVFDVPLSVCLSRNASREHTLPPDRLTTYHSQYLDDRPLAVAEQWSSVTYHPHSSSSSRASR